MDENKIEPSIYRYILRHTRKDQLLLLLLTGISMPFVYASLEVPKIIINGALGGVDIPDEIFGVPMNQVKYLLVLCFVFLALVLVNGGMKYVINVYRGVVGERMLRRFRFDLFSRILRFPLPRFKQLSQAEIIPMITAETEPLGGFIGDAFALPAFQGGLLLTYLFFIFNQDVFLGLAAIALYPPQLYVIPKLQQRVNRLAAQRVQAVRRFSDKVGETVSGIADIHVNDTSHFEKAHASHRLATIYRIRYDIYRKKFFIKFLNNFLAQLTPFFFYAIGGYFVITGELSLGALVAVLAAYKDLATPWRELLKYYQITEDVRVKYRVIIDQFQPDKMLPQALQEDQENIPEFKDASFQALSVKYSEDDFLESLEGVSFSLAPAQKLGVLGLAGSGRNVLMQIAVRLLHPNYGRIRIDDQDIAELSESVLGRGISYVDQQSWVFNGTVRDNLLYGLKHRPVKDSKSSPEDSKERKLYISDAIISANSADDINADWLDFDAAGFESSDEFNQRMSDILVSTGLDNDVYQLGLGSTVDQGRYPELVDGILTARRRMREEIGKGEFQKLVEALDEQHYNVYMNAADNLLFGVPLTPDLDPDQIMAHPEISQIIDSAGLKRPMFGVGLQAAKAMVDIFSDVPEDSPFFEQFSFFRMEDLPALTRLSKLPDQTKLDSLEEKDANLLINMAFKLNVARHRLGLLTPALQEKIIDAHIMLKQKLGENNELIDFYNEHEIAGHLSIQDNILFGRVAHGRINARQKVGALIQAVISDLGLGEQIIAVGLDYPVGVGGSRLTSIQRQKLTIARALVKQPTILVVNGATAIFDSQHEQAMMKRVLDAVPESSVIWVLGNVDHVGNFDKLLVLDKGKLIAEGGIEDVRDHLDNLASN